MGKIEEKVLHTENVVKPQSLKACKLAVSLGSDCFSDDSDSNQRQNFRSMFWVLLRSLVSPDMFLPSIVFLFIFRLLLVLI